MAGLFIPFFVLGKKDEFDIVYDTLTKYDKAILGILTTPFSASNELIDTLRHMNNNINIASRMPVFCDSGAFLKNGKKLSYPELFNMYNYINADFGVVFDTLYDKEATLKTTRVAMDYYRLFADKWRFQLIGVAQGRKPEDYIDCILSLKRQGYTYIALGGMIQKSSGGGKRRTSTDKLTETLKMINDFHIIPKWLFAFGSFHETRWSLFEKYNVWGADSSGWLIRWPHKYELCLYRIQAISDNQLDTYYQTLYKLFRHSASQRYREKNKDNKDGYKYFSDVKNMSIIAIKNFLSLVAAYTNDPILCSLVAYTRSEINRFFMIAYLQEIAERQLHIVHHCIQQRIIARMFVELLKSTYTLTSQQEEFEKKGMEVVRQYYPREYYSEYGMGRAIKDFMLETDCLDKLVMIYNRIKGRRVKKDGDN